MRTPIAFVFVLLLAVRAYSSDLWVELVDTTGRAPAVLELVCQEIETIYRPATNIRWIIKGPEGGREPPHFARIYIMEAIPPSLSRGLENTGGGPPMAIAFGRDGKKSGPNIYVSLSAVSIKAGGDMGPQTLARALGRVIAHELAHRFLSFEHTVGIGILRSGFSKHDLVNPDARAFAIDQKQIAQLVELCNSENIKREGNNAR